MERCYCGQDNPNGAKYCNSCGARISPRDRTDARVCAACGQRMNYDVYFSVCQHCGFTHQISISKPNGSRFRTPLKYVLMYYASLAIPGAGLFIGGAYSPTCKAERRMRLDCAVLGVLNLAVLAMIAYLQSTV